MAKVTLLRSASLEGVIFVRQSQEASALLREALRIRLAEQKPGNRRYDPFPGIDA